MSQDEPQPLLFRTGEKIRCPVRRLHGEKSVVEFHVCGEEPVGLFYRPDTGYTHFHQQTVLQRPPQALHTALRLGGEGRDMFYAQHVEHLPVTGEGDFPSLHDVLLTQLLSLLRREENSVAVRVECRRNAPGTQHVLHDAEIACRTFMLLESQGQYRAGGVVYGAVERPFFTVLQPLEGSGIHLDQAPETFAALPAPVALPPPPSVGVRHSRVIEDPTYGLGAYPYSIDSFQKLGHVVQARPSVFPDSFGAHHCPCLLRKGIRRPPVAVSVGQGRNAPCQDLCFQTEDLPPAHAEAGCTFRSSHLPFHDPVQDR